MIDTATRALLSLGCFVGVGAALMLPLTQGGTSERIVSILSLLLGAGIVVGSVLVRRFTHHRGHRDDAMSDLTDDDAVVTNKEHS